MWWRLSPSVTASVHSRRAVVAGPALLPFIARSSATIVTLTAAVRCLLPLWWLLALLASLPYTAAAVATCRPSARACPLPFIVSHSVAVCVPSLSVLQRAAPARRAMTSSASSTRRRFARSCCRVQVTVRRSSVSRARQSTRSAHAGTRWATAPSPVAVTAPVAMAPRPVAAVAAKGSAARQAAPPAPAMGMDRGFDPALLEAPLPDFDDVDPDDDDMDPEDEAALLALTGSVPTQPTGTPAAHVHVPGRTAAAAAVTAASVPAQQPRGAVLLAAAVAPVARCARMATPPHMAPVTVRGITVDPCCSCCSAYTSPTTSRCWATSR
jgi:hypothetical protein